jgi:hypothetical protein
MDCGILLFTLRPLWLADPLLDETAGDDPHDAIISVTASKLRNK